MASHHPSQRSARAGPLTIVNSVTAGGAAVSGGVYTVTKTATVDPATGVETVVAGTPILVNAGETVALDQYSVYSVQQTTRAPGYYLDPNVYTVEFPLLENGAIAANQSLTINPKVIPVTGDVSLLKTANDTTTAVPGATFDLYRTVDASGTTLATPELVTAGLVTGADGTISATALTEGQYYFIETATVAPYAVDTTTQHAFTVTVDATGTATAPIAQLTAQNYTQPSASTVTKQVNGGATASASIGETVTFTIDIQVPNDIADNANYTVTDVVDSRFSNVAVTPWTGFATSVTGNTVTAVADPATLTPGTHTLTITATLNNTTATGDSVPNLASVAWDNGKGDSGTFDTNQVTVTLVEGSITVTKVDGENTATLLPGATFILTDAAGNQLTDVNGLPYEVTTDAAGVAVFDRLPYGTYYLRETAAPTGYRLNDRLIEVTVDSTTTDAAVQVSNYLTSSSLPITGTLAAIPFYVAGGLLIGLFFWLRRRNANREATPRS